MKGLRDYFDARKHKKELRGWAMALHDRLAGSALATTRDEGLGLKDDFSLRFEVMTLLVSHHLFHLRQLGDALSGERMQALWEIMFEGFEYSLRHRGVNDIRIASRMRKLFQQATGRRDVFLAALESGDVASLRAAIARNVLNGAPPEDERIDRLLALMESA